MTGHCPAPARMWGSDMRSVIALCLISTTAAAEPLLTAEAFDALTLGRTMTWAEYG